MGELHLILGCMYAGKTEELLRLVRREFVAGRSVALFKPCMDKRYSATHISSHNKSQLQAHMVETAQDIAQFIASTPIDVIGIDELQFFGEDIISFCMKLIREKSPIKLIAGGLTKDFRGDSFRFLNSQKHIGELMPYAASITLLHAICTHRDSNGNICGKPADYSQRFIDGRPASYDSPIVLVGSLEAYEARCGFHHIVPGRKTLAQFERKTL